tara:strand:+ start:222 stop:752 length:531 start_codon:yes stop_codon:yes gene_type:complete
MGNTPSSTTDISKIDTVKLKNYNYYKKLQEARGNFNYTYGKKEYPRGFTSHDKKIVDGRYSPARPIFTKKQFLLLLSLVILVLIFSQILRKNKGYFAYSSFLVVLFLLAIPFFYMMKASYYSILAYVIIIIILGNMGYGWGLFSVILNLNPLKKKPKTPPMTETPITNAKPPPPAK